MKHQQGFTIAELMIAVIIAAVLAAIAAPNMSEFVKNNARAARVSLCKSAGGTACDAANVGGAGNFAGGWIVFTDGDVRGTVDPDDLVLRIFQPDMGGFATLTGANTPIGAIRGLPYENTGLGRARNFERRPSLQIHRSSA
jgi:prepilin-type N-terminal cleavage/methylation domain-containing protein